MNVVVAPHMDPIKDYLNRGDRVLCGAEATEAVIRWRQRKRVEQLQRERQRQLHLAKISEL